ncbi:hypothetical protein D3C71_1695870 [compost metagenome]
MHFALCRGQALVDEPGFLTQHRHLHADEPTELRHLRLAIQGNQPRLVGYSFCSLLNRVPSLKGFPEALPTGHDKLSRLTRIFRQFGMKSLMLNKLCTPFSLYCQR